MLFKIEARNKSPLQITSIEPAASPVLKDKEISAESANDARRQMYERIAQGHTISEAEDNARRTWGGK